MTLQTILVATDFSKNAGVARIWAEQLARQHRALLVLVHALEAEPFSSPELASVVQAHQGTIAASVAGRLEREAEKSRAAGVTVECELVVGSPSAGVVDAARRRHADLIVSGTRGRTSWKRLLLGSTAARVIRTAPCPVITVHRTDVGSPRMARTALVPTDFSEDAALAADAALRVLGGMGANRRLVLLHAYDVPSEATYLPAPILMDAISAVDTDVKRRIEALAAPMRNDAITVDTLACVGHPARVILDQARAVGADLIAMGTHGRSGADRLVLGSTAERVVALASCPVLTVRRH